MITSGVERVNMLLNLNMSLSFSICYVFSFLKDRLDEYNDDYRAAQPPFQVRLNLILSFH